MSNRAWVTLATNDSYGLGALVLAHSLRRVGSVYPAVILITPSVTEAMRNRLRAVFADVITVDVLDSRDAAHLALLQRPELGITFTKIHCWSLTQFEKCVFLDADILVTQNCDELFEREELSAAPDVGWPDCFNSGVFVYTPSADTFSNLIKFAQDRGSFDGGDQGLLNSYFSDWARGDVNKRLPFLYNVTSAAFYSYLPALKHYGQDLKIIHFIGATKPWLQQFNWESRSVDAPEHIRHLLQLWWDLFVGQVHPQLDTTMVEVEGSPPAIPPQEIVYALPKLDYRHYEPTLDPESEFPWHHPDHQVPEAELNVPKIDMTQFYNPWDTTYYRGNIPPSTDANPNQSELQMAENPQAIRKYAWEYTAPQDFRQEGASKDHTQSWQVAQQQHYEHTHDDVNNSDQHEKMSHTQQTYHEHKENFWDANFHVHGHDHHSYQKIHSHEEHSHKHHHFVQSSHSEHDHQHHYGTHGTHEHNNQDHKHDVHEHKHVDTRTLKNTHHSQNTESLCFVHLDQENQNHYVENLKSDLKINGYGSDTGSEDDEHIPPRHPYDGFYLRHRMTIDSRGRKICSHEIPPESPSLPPESPPLLEEPLPIEENNYTDEFHEIEDQSGVAGNLARVVPGTGFQREALDELARRQGWEAGNIDYMGADSFDNIWAKISQTLSQPRTSPPKQAPESAPVEAAKEAPVASPPVEPTPAAEPVKKAEVPAPPAPVAEVPAPVESVDSSASGEAAAPGETSASAEAPVPSEVSAAAEQVPEAAQADQAPASEGPVAAPTDAEVPVSIDNVQVESTTPSPEAAVAEDIKKTEETVVPETVEISPTVTETQPSVEAVPDVLKSAAIPLGDGPKSEAIPMPDIPVATSETPAVVEVKSEQSVPVVAETSPSTETQPAPVEPVPKSDPIPSSDLPVSVVAATEETKKTEEPAVTAVETPTSVAQAAPTETVPEVVKSDPIPTSDAPVPVVVQEPAVEKTNEKSAASTITEVPPSTEPATDVVKPEPVPISDTPVPVVEATEAKTEVTPEKVNVPASDSPPLANTPSKEEAPPLPTAKSEERRKPAGKLQLRPPTAPDALPTPDSEQEDAAALAQSIIAGELRTPTVTAPSPPAGPASPPPPLQHKRLSVEEPEVPTPPVGAVSLSQIGVKPAKPTIAAQIESSVAPEPTPAPEAAPAKKKVVKKVVKKDKEGATSGEAPVPPPRKKEKKPKEK